MASCFENYSGRMWENCSGDLKNSLEKYNLKNDHVWTKGWFKKISENSIILFYLTSVGVPSASWAYIKIPSSFLGTADLR